ncbi:MAG: DUF3455 domain-containing protein [Aquabacterium sp.]|uniref:DUF3455 domain-containing protein n=2 Tax=Aquabacterium TaxID=92793 RepID=UPI001D479DD3|nr:DUF3455 domain-containing protein [Aquabacterium sp.]
MNNTSVLSLRSLPLTAVATVAVLSILAGCASQPMVKNAELPEAVRVPAGHTQSMFTVGSGELTYECREKKDMAGAFEWAFVGPVATLSDAKGTVVGKYYAGPTWESNDGSKVTGKQVAVSPAAAGNIPLQLVKANPASGAGVMQGVSFIQRLNTVGGVAPALPCGAEQKGSKKVVGYKADYAFYKPAM